MKKSELTAERIKEIRVSLGLSVTEFAARLGVSASCVYFYETNKTRAPFAVGELIKQLRAN